MIHVSCNLCGADDWRLRYPATLNGSQAIDVAAFRCTNPGYGHHAQIVECRRCGHVYANPRWTPEELLQAYGDVEDETYLDEREGRELTFARHLAALEKITGPANGRSLLDIGAYIGVFVEAALAAGWDAVGVEPSTWAAGVGRARGLPIVEGTQHAPALDGRQFDVITMWDVIEHVADPTGELAAAYQKLKPGGTIAVHTMDIDSHAARLLRTRWPWLMDMHIHYFSQASLSALLARLGYEVVWSGAQGRYLRLGYLASRVTAFSRPLGEMVEGAVRGLRLSELAVPVNFGDLFTVFARRPSGDI